MPANIRERLRLAFSNWLIATTTRRKPDFVVGDANTDHVYLRRWWVLPRNPLVNVYLHEFVSSDDDRALHDHPWFSLSLTLRGVYREMLPTSQAQGAGWDYMEGGIRSRLRWAGGWVARSPWMRHRIETVGKDSAWTLFITGPILREWGFHCRHGWVPWRNFVDSRNKGSMGAGCDGAPRRGLPFWKVWSGRDA